MDKGSIMKIGDTINEVRVEGIEKWAGEIMSGDDTNITIDSHMCEDVNVIGLTITIPYRGDEKVIDVYIDRATGKIKSAG